MSQVDVQLVNTACTGQGAKCTQRLKDGEWSGDDYGLSSLTPPSDSSSLLEMRGRHHAPFKSGALSLEDSASVM